MKVSLYGLGNCDTTRAARRWLDERSIDYQFVDVRRDGVAANLISDWVGRHGWQKVLNRRSTTWRELPASNRDGVDEQAAIALIAAHPTLMKRPVLVTNSQVLIGFDQQAYASAIG